MDEFTYVLEHEVDIWKNYNYVLHFCRTRTITVLKKYAGFSRNTKFLKSRKTYFVDEKKRHVNFEENCDVIFEFYVIL